MRSLFTLMALAPAMVIAQAPADGTQALVAKYAAMIKNYPTLLNEAKAKNQHLPLDATPEFLSVSIAHETRPGVRQVLLAARFFLLKALAGNLDSLKGPVADYGATVNTSSMLELCGQMSPDSPALDLVAAVDPEFLGWIAWHRSGGGYVPQTEASAADKAFAFYDQVIAQHPSRTVKLLAMESALELHSRPRMLKEVRQDLARLEAFDPGAPSIKTWKAWLKTAELEDKVAPKVGNAIPVFTVNDLDHPGTALTPASFKGKYWILDFWATWCGPCKGELPYVHKAYAKYHPAGLEILSVSSDRKVEDIAKFRKDPEHPMPWLHAFPEGAAREELMKLFQVRGIPHVLLIDPAGKIIAMNEALRGEGLEQTLGKYLKAK